MKRALVILLGLRRWHGRMGFAAAVFFLLLVLSGIALNHGHALGLDGRHLHSAWLARWYGLPFDPAMVFRSGEHRLLAANGRWILDGRALGDDLPRPVGFVALAGSYYVAGAGDLYIFQSDGKLVDKIGTEALPASPIQVIGAIDNRLVVQTAATKFSSEDGMTWMPLQAENVRWSAAEDLSQREQQATASELAPAVSWQRLLQDLHSGRLFGRFGPLAMDVVAIVLALLALSGAWLFLRRRHPRQRRWP